MKRDEKGLLLVSASERCELFEESQIDALAPIRECWFCKWSDFRRKAPVIIRKTATRQRQCNRKSATGIIS